MLKNKNKKTNKNFIFRCNVLLAIIFASVIFVNLIVANHAANQRYEISQYLKEYNSLQFEKERLSLTVAELQSSERLSAESQRLNLVKADSVRYIASKGPVVMKK